MKYVIRFNHTLRERNYYKGTFVRDATSKLSQASIFTSADRATDILDTMSEAWFPSVEEITDKELFEARLKGI